MASWYERNRDHCLEVAKKYRENNEDKIKAYQAEYYKKRRAAMPPKPPKPPKPVPEAPAGFIKMPKNPQIQPSKGKKRGCRPPKATYEFTPKEQETDGWFMKPHQRDKLLATCPLGFFQAPSSSNPFYVTFS